MPVNDHADLLRDITAAMAAVRERQPLVQCLTNMVVSQITADVLLAIGAAPAMVDNRHEAAEFAAVADAVLVNVGTITDETALAMGLAVAAARGPWVLDPVAVGGLGHRTSIAIGLLDHSPTVIRGNSSEVIALAGAGAGGRGVDSTHDVLAALPAAQTLAVRTGGAVAVSGPADLVTSSDARGVLVESGHPMMQRVIGTGCALGAMVAAYAAVVDDPFVAAVAAHAHTGAAGAVAGQQTQAPGSFGVAWRDALYQMDAATIREHVRITAVEDLS